MKVEGKGRVVLTLIDKIEDMVFILKKAFNKEGGGGEGFSIENRGVHVEKRKVSKKACLA
jgi:hypothetical protein